MTLAERLRRALSEGGTGAGMIGGDTMAPGAHADAPGQPAAVLIAVVDRPEPTVILTRRSDSLRNHAGQVAFPGGRVDKGDADVVEAALREAREEIGLDPALVQVVGTADAYRTGTGFRVTPVVGVVPPDLALAPHEAEVAAVFEVPFAYLLDPANHLPKSEMWKGIERHYLEIPHAEYRIWGATAGMIANLARRLALP